VSLQAITWCLDESEARGSDRLVLFVMCHYTRDDGYSWCSKATLADEAKVAESTIPRAHAALVALGEIGRAEVAQAPPDYLAIPTNRRPSLFVMTGFLGSHFATPIRRRAARKPGVSQGSTRGLTGVAAVASDQGFCDANYELETKTPSRLVDSNDKDPDPGCIRCSGSGRIYRGGNAATGALDVRCSCTFVRQPAEILAGLDLPPDDAEPAPPPWVEAGMTLPEWREREARESTVEA
jgi:hypothetical protein